MTQVAAASIPSEVLTPDRFLVLWQDPETRCYQRVGYLERDGAGYSFRYEPGARELEGFTGFAEFPDWSATYRSQALFATFANRVMTPRREGYERYIESLGVPGPRPEPFEVLAVTLGARATDNVQLLPMPRRNAGGALSLQFLVHGARHVDPDATLLAGVEAGDTLYLASEPDNPHSPLAVLVGPNPGPTRDSALGYVPDVLAGLVGQLLHDYPIAVTAAHVNRPTDEPVPDHMRLLVRLDAVVPIDFDPDALLGL